MKPHAARDALTALRASSEVAASGSIEGDEGFEETEKLLDHGDRARRPS